MSTNETTDPWRGIRRGDRFYVAGWNAQEGDQIWVEVTDLWFDPVRGQHNPKRGYLVAIDLMAIGQKRALAAASLVGKGYVRMEVAHAKAESDMRRFGDQTDAE